MGRAIRTILCLVGLSGVFFSHDPARAETNAVVLEGILTSTSYNGGIDPAGNPTHEPAVSNAVSLAINRDGRWFIECRRLYPVGDAMYGKEQVEYLSFDGSDCYHAQYSEANRTLQNDELVVASTTPIKSKVNDTYISKGNYPASPFEGVTEEFVHVLWIMCGAGEAFHADPAREIPLPWVPERWTPLAYGFRSEADLSSTPPYIPRQFRFIRDNRLDLPNFEAELDREQLDKSHNGPWLVRLKADWKRRQTEWPPGFMAGQFKASLFTNLNGMDIPLSFVFEDYDPRLLAPGKLLDRYAAVFTNIMPAPADQSYRPPLLSKIVVTDSRVRFRDDNKQVDKLLYRLKTNDHWMAVSDPFLTNRLFALSTDPQFTARYPLESVKRKRLIIMGLLLLVTFVVPVLLYRKARANIPGNNQY